MDFLHRSFDVDSLEVTPTGVVTGLVVPYNSPTEILELRGDGLIRYREQFAPGSMDRAAKAPNRVMLQFTHSEDFDKQLGYGLAFRDSAEGCVGEFQLYRSTAERATEMLTSSHRGLSVTFASLRPQQGLERDGELVTREAVMCRAVAAVNDPAYADAGVLAVRAQAEAAAQMAAEARRKREEMTTLLQFLVDAGQPLTEAHRSWLAAEGVQLREVTA